ncbi:Spy/CpxP family protein refolding chaperone [Microbulbifer sp. TYP-18]|uniref:Spy/CpxP family protein refolding chaperone n=1 Tax=Microbulbifer sp. TYP-18 TaxID=3230024 RepID=UPI0034C62AFF
MQNRISKLGSFLLAGALVAPAAVLAHGGEDGDRGIYRQKFERMAEQLNLTEGQRAQLKTDRAAGREIRRDQKREIRDLRRQVRESVRSGADQQTLDKLGAELGRLEVARMRQTQLMQQQFEAILTDEQKAKLQQIRSERQERWQKRSADRLQKPR